MYCTVWWFDTCIYTVIKPDLNSLYVSTGGFPWNLRFNAMLRTESSSCKYDAGTNWSIKRRYSGLRPPPTARPATKLNEYLCTCTCVYMCVYMCLHVCMYMCIYMYMYIRIYMYMYICTCICCVNVHVYQRVQ